MPNQTLALLHTSPVLTPLFASLCARWLPETRIFHVVDESLIKNTIQAGRLEKVTVRRLAALVGSAFDAGADAVLVTCSSIGPAVEVARQLYDQPVLRVDEPMARDAVRRGHRIGVLATLRTTLEPTSALVRSQARAASRPVEIVECLCEGAFEAVLCGDTATHDRLVSEALTERMRDVDAIVLAQASMARVVAALPPGAVRAPILSSPDSGVRQVREAFGLRPG
ncbi:MAG: aspartate/glutamate racemase family protein [Pseudomonadota bacterium]|jgi:Asp/Glu/hydantoin racemase|nr:aspartate/glutamate racemase family protein [Pseudomonadota bacterium]